MQRIVVNGASGSGKTTVARMIGERLGLPHTEIDSLFHGPDWTPRPEFLDDVRRIVARERWVAEFQYDAARPLLLDRCDLVVWLDPPAWRQMAQVVRRTVSRRLRRTELWNGNREGPLWQILVDDEHIIRWAWRTRRDAADRIAVIAARRPDLPVVRLRTRRDVRRWLADVSGGGTPAPPR